LLGDNDPTRTLAVQCPDLSDKFVAMLIEQNNAGAWPQAQHSIDLAHKRRQVNALAWL
jgi:hypothetical protein